MGWFFLWDILLHGEKFEESVADPWISLGAIAAKTNKIKLGVFMTPLARRRPWKVARETVTLDYLNEGRLIFGVGLSLYKQDFEAFGETADPSIRASLLNEGLEIIDELWSGKEFFFHGNNYNLVKVKFRHRPVQHPRIPIWLAGF